MSAFRIFTDSACDLTPSQRKKLEVRCVQLRVHLPSQAAIPMENREKELKPLYARLRKKERITTSAANVTDFVDAFVPALENGEDILYLGLASALSCTCQNGAAAAADLEKRYPQRKIHVVDTGCASLGLGLLVTLTAQQRLAGKDLEQSLRFAQSTGPRICQWFTVDDLQFLRRGGRLSHEAALVGTLLQIKPLLHTNPAGCLVPAEKVKGRRRALDALVDKVQKGAPCPEKQRVMICHGDCPEDAEYVKTQLKKRLGVRQVDVGLLGPVVAAHGGPGALAVFYLGENR